MKRSRKIISLVKHEKGQAMVEFALILPILLLLLCGIIELSWLLFGKISLQNAASEAARAGSVGTTVTEAIDKAEDRIEALIPPQFAEDLDIDISFSTPSSFRSGDITVELEAYTSPLTPIAGIFGLDEIHLLTSCTMKMN